MSRKRNTAAPIHHKHNGCTTGDESWKIYDMTRRSDRKRYIGVTARKLRARFNAHRADALRAERANGRSGTLAEAIREAVAAGLTMDQAFEIRELRRCYSPDEARQAEAFYIMALGTAAPAGFNLMPGGSSLGSKANALTITLRHPIRGKLVFAPISDAIAMRNAELTEKGRRPLNEALVYWRLATGWPPEEALGYRRHQDRRGQRDGLLCNGIVVRSLRAASAQLGVSIDTLRSRAHRARRAGLLQADLAQDRRLRGADRAPRHKVQLPHPSDPTAPPLNTVQFAQVSGVSKATVIHRLHQLRAAGRDPDLMSRDELLAALLPDRDGRTIIALPLPGGGVLRGGIREIARAVVSKPTLRRAQVERIGAAAIRARLRKTLQQAVPDISWACGMAPRRPDATA